MKRLLVILFVLPLFAQNQWGITEVQDPCNNQEYLILKKRVYTKGANDLMPIKNGVIDFEKYEFFRHYDKLCLEYKKNPCGYSGYQTLKKKGVVNLTASEFETYKIFDSACLKQESARRRGAEYQYVEGNEWSGGKYQKSNPEPTVPQKPVQTEANEDGDALLDWLLNTIQDNQRKKNNSLGRTCQYDDNELIKTFHSKIENGKIAYKWECVPFGNHTYWIVE